MNRCTTSLNSVLALSFLGGSLSKPSWEKGSLSVWLLYSSFALACLLSRCICLLQPLWRVCWRVAFAGLSLTLVGLNLTAEVRIGQISLEQHPTATAVIVSLQEAAAMFPLDHNIRRAPAQAAVTMSGQIPPRKVLTTLEGYLRTDPHAKDTKAQIAELNRHLLETKQ
jgi:hypothetical protein